MRRLLRMSMWVALLLLLLPASVAEASPVHLLASQLVSLAARLRHVLLTDPRFVGQKVRMGLFPGPQLPNSNFGQQIRRELTSALADLVSDKGKLVITGRYDVVESATDRAADDPNHRLHVLRLVAGVEDQSARTLVTEAVEVNNTDDVLHVAGATAAPPLHGSQKVRNLAVKQALESPDFRLVGGTRVAPVNFDAQRPFSVEVLVKDTLDGPASPVRPQNVKGLAFVDVKPSEFYEIRLSNDGDFEGAAEISIDGLSVLGQFNEGPTKPRHYIVPAHGSTTIRGWLHTTAAGAKDSVLAFLVTEYGHGAATRLKRTGEVGVITVRFSACWQEGKEPPAGEKGARAMGRETAAGPGMSEQMNVLPRRVGMIRSTVSIRYSPTGTE